MLRQDIHALLNQRYATRKMTATKTISAEDFDTILEAGRLSASSFGMEPWCFVVVQDPALREQLLPHAWGAQRTLPDASHFVVLLARKAVDLRYDAPYITHIIRDIQQLPEEAAQAKRAVYQTFQETGFDLLGDERHLFGWACKQTYIALANMMMTAAMLGIDSCPIEGFSREAVERVLVEAGVLDPTHFGVSVMLSLGYRDEAIRPKTRRAQSDVVKWV